jgi:hypothetical protein
MKSISFQRNKSLIRIVNEKQNKQKRNWDRIVYLVLLSLFSILLIYYICSKIFYIHANGHVIIESTKIRLTDDARIIDMYVSEGDSIAQNDTLFSYALDLDQDQTSSAFNTDILASASGSSADLWHLKETYGLKKSIEVNNTKIRENTELINAYNTEIKRLTNEVILDVLPKTRLDVVQNEIMKLKNENKQMEDENRTYGQLVSTIVPLPSSGSHQSQKQIKRNGRTTMPTEVRKPTFNKLFFTDELLTREKFFRAPMGGIVTRIYVKATETALKTEEIMNIHRGYPAYIKAFFEQKDLRYFTIGDKFTLEFPDGTTSTGILRRFYIATYQMPEEFQAKYEPTTRTIAGDIYPEKDEDREKWLIFNKMSVEIKKFKY